MNVTSTDNHNDNHTGVTPPATLESKPDVRRTHRFWTVPNGLCLIRLMGSPVMVGLALMGEPVAVLVTFVLLASTDWIDGKLAVWLDQRSDFGAQLDSWADATLYSALLFSSIWLRSDMLMDEQWLIVAAVGSYVLSTAAGLWKFHRWPSYHTYAAKISWWIIAVGGVCLLGAWTIWPLRIALAAVTLTNLEALAITWTLPNWKADVRSLRRAKSLK